MGTTTDRVSSMSPRLDAKPWGGQRLARFGFDFDPAERIGEALVTAGDAAIASGFGEGQTLDEVVTGDPLLAGSLGSAAVSGKPIFPLLVKLIDANENLSIQVHPDDARADRVGKLGKTEAWFVLAADPGSSLYLGMALSTTQEDIQASAAVGDGSMAELSRVIHANANRTVLIPAGTIHALGAGVMVYEIQQPSDITYRLDDWGRRDAQGRPREMHVEAGLEASRLTEVPEWIEPVSLKPAIGERHLLVACRYFGLERVALPAGGTSEIGSESSPAVVTVLDGSCDLGGQSLQRGRSAVVWPGSGTADLRAAEPLVALVAIVPDVAALEARLEALGVPASQRRAIVRSDL